MDELKALHLVLTMLGFATLVGASMLEIGELWRQRFCLNARITFDATALVVYLADIAVVYAWAGVHVKSGWMSLFIAPCCAILLTVNLAKKKILSIG